MIKTVEISVETKYNIHKITSLLKTTVLIRKSLHHITIVKTLFVAL